MVYTRKGVVYLTLNALRFQTLIKHNFHFLFLISFLFLFSLLCPFPLLFLSLIHIFTCIFICIFARNSNLLRKGIREPSTLRDPMASQPQLRPASPGLQPGIFKDFDSWPEHFDSRPERP